MAQSQIIVPKMYRGVIDDVINGVRDVFLDDGVDEQVLLELKQIWETKLMVSKAIEVSSDHHDHPQSAGHQANHNHSARQSSGSHQQIIAQQQQQQATQQQQQAQQQSAHQSTVGTNITLPDSNRLIPVQITVPGQTAVNRPAKALTIHVPALALQGNQLQTLLSTPTVAATFALPAEVAAAALQQQITVALQERGIHVPVGITPATSVQFPTMGTAAVQSRPGVLQTLPQPTAAQNQVVVSNSGTISQLDGTRDTSDDEDDEDEEEDLDDDENEDKDEEDNEEDNNFGVQEEEPLNSEDDVSEDDPGDLFDTDNVVVCQYDKITRSRNKWKFHLKDGIMNLNGKDFVFQKANGDAEW